MINLLELTPRQVYITAGAAVAIGIAAIVTAAVMATSAAPSMKQTSDVVKPTTSQVAKPDVTPKPASEAQDAPVVNKPTSTPKAQPARPTQPQQSQGATPATPAQPNGPGTPATPAQPAQPTQPQPCDYPGCRPPIDISTLTPRICYIGIASQDIELRTACGKGLGIWATMNEAIAWLNKHGWQ